MGYLRKGNLQARYFWRVRVCYGCNYTVGWMQTFEWSAKAQTQYYTATALQHTSASHLKTFALDASSFERYNVLQAFRKPASLLAISRWTHQQQFIHHGGRPETDKPFDMFVTIPKEIFQFLASSTKNQIRINYLQDFVLFAKRKMRAITAPLGFHAWPSMRPRGVIWISEFSL